MTVMSDALLDAHRKNLTRYCQLLATELTPLEQDYLHRRIAETHDAIERLEARSPADRVRIAQPAAVPLLGASV